MANAKKTSLWDRRRRAVRPCYSTADTRFFPLEIPTLAVQIEMIAALVIGIATVTAGGFFGRGRRGR